MNSKVSLADRGFAAASRNLLAACGRMYLAVAVTTIMHTGLLAQEIPVPAVETEQPADDPQGKLVTNQSQIADKYAKLEQILIRRAELESATNPQRAALLKQAVRESANRSTRRQLQEIVRLLEQEQLKDALDQQETVHTDLQALLKLLLTEDRADRLKGEQQRIKDYIKEVERLQRLQGSTRARTEGATDPQKLSGEQEKIAERTGNLADQIRKNEEGGSSKSGEVESDDSGKQGEQGQGEQSGDKENADEENDNQEKDNDSSDTKKTGDQDKEEPSSDKEPGEGSPKDQPADGSPSGEKSESKPSEGKNSEGDMPSDGSDQSQPGQSQQGQPQQGQPQDDQPQSPPGEQPEMDNPARQRIEAAENRMREAQKRLEESKKDEALEEQLAAEEELRKAKAELEEILRQLREEEVERMLALLEGRFRKMLEMQLKVYEATVQLDKTPAEERGREIDIQASRLSVDQRKIMLEADRALTLLLEEGSSVSFPEVVREMRDNMEQVVERLARGMVDTLTQTTEEDIIESLEEMIAALEKAQKDLEQKQQQPQPQGPMQMVEPPLVDQLTELKMIRALQMRVNKRTQRFAALLESPEDVKGQATDAELRGALQNLSEREESIHQITRDIVLGKNR